MDFFNKLGKKASETYQITKEKTTKLSGELKLRNKINDSKNKISKLYEEIGKIIYLEYKNGNYAENEEVKAKCGEIDELNEEIKKAENDILELKDIKKCIDCGAEIDLKVEFCPKCGKEQPKIEKVEVKEEPQDAQTIEATEVTDVNTENDSASEEDKKED